MPGRRWPSTAGVNPKAQVYDQRPRLPAADLLAPLDQGAEAHSGTGTLDAVASFGQTGRKADGGTGAIAVAATLGQKAHKTGIGIAATDASAVLTSVGMKNAYSYIEGPGMGSASGSGGTIAYAAILSSGPVQLVADADGTTLLTAEDGTSPLIADIPLAVGVKAALGSGALAVSATFASTNSRTSAGTGTLSVTTSQASSGAKSSSGTGTISLSAGFTEAGHQSGVGVGGMSLTAALAGTGRKDAFGSDAITEAATLSASGTASSSEAHAGTGALTLTASLVSAGRKDANGMGALGLGASMAATGQSSAAPQVIDFSAIGYGAPMRRRLPLVPQPLAQSGTGVIHLHALLTASGVAWESDDELVMALAA